MNDDIAYLCSSLLALVVIALGRSAIAWFQNRRKG